MEEPARRRCNKDGMKLNKFKKAGNACLSRDYTDWITV